MAHAFKTIPAKPAFGTVRPLLYSDDYLTIKKQAALFANPVNKNNKNGALNYETYYLSRYNRLLRSQVNPANLIYNLYSVENLKDVTSVGTNPYGTPATTIDPASKPFYKFYRIDPNGELFGNSQCGELNFVHYMQPNFCLKNPVKEQLSLDN